MEKSTKNLEDLVATRKELQEIISREKSMISFQQMGMGVMRKTNEPISPGKQIMFYLFEKRIKQGLEMTEVALKEVEAKIKEYDQVFNVQHQASKN